MLLNLKREAGRKSMRTDTTIQDVFNRFLPEYAQVSNFSERQYLAVKCITSCRTAEMGAHVSECESCHNTYIHYNSCKNRHCPMCQSMDVDVWIDNQQENYLFDSLLSNFLFYMFHKDYFHIFLHQTY